MKEVFSPKELAHRWAISSATLERWRWQGVGPRYLKIGGRIRYPIQVIEQYEAQRMHSPVTSNNAVSSSGCSRCNTAQNPSSEISLRN
jgi:predicted site-specific integrase-resolvase